MASTRVQLLEVHPFFKAALVGREAAVLLESCLGDGVLLCAGELA